MIWTLSQHGLTEDWFEVSAKPFNPGVVPRLWSAFDMNKLPLHIQMELFHLAGDGHSMALEKSTGDTSVICSYTAVIMT